MRSGEGRGLGTSAGTPARWDRRSALALAAICALGGALRLAHLQQIAAHDPFFALPEVDGAVYHAWAQRIAAGEIWGDEVLFLGPLYPFGMAAVYAVFGPSLWVWKAVQAALGVASCALIAQLALRVFDRRVALLAAAFAALYRMLIFYGGTVMVVNVQLPLVIGTLLAADRALREPGPGRGLVAGLVLGLAVLGRQTALLFAPVLAVGLVALPAAALRRRAGAVAALGLGIALPILPFTVHNYAVSGDFVLLNSTGGANLFMGNNPWADGSWVRPPIGGLRVDNPLAMREAFTAAAEAQLGRALRPSEVSRFWAGLALDFATEQPGRWLALEARKLLLFVNKSEIWNIQSIEITREFSWVLRIPLLEFGLVAPLGLLGVGLAARRWRALFPLYGMLAVQLAAALAFFVLARYRMPAVAILMIFAAHAVVRVVEWARARQWPALARAGAVALALAALVHVPVREPSLAMAYFNLGNKYKALERWPEAIESYHRALAIRPTFMPAVNNLALALEGAGDAERAIEIWQAVLRASLARGDALHRDRALRHLEDLGAPAEDLPQPAR